MPDAEDQAHADTLPVEAGADAVGGLPPLLTLGDVTQLFHRSPRTIREWRASGRLHTVRIGRGVYVRREEILRLMGDL